MTSISKIKLSLCDTKIPAFNQFCEMHDLSYTVRTIKLGDITQNWRFLTEDESNQIVDNPLTMYDKLNVPGVYALGYGNNFQSFHDTGCIYVGESSSKYNGKPRTGVGQRIMMALKDFDGQSSNHNGKFLRKRNIIAKHFDDIQFEESKLRIAFRPHEEYAKWDKSYSHKMEILALNMFKEINLTMPVCNHMSGTYTT